MDVATLGACGRMCLGRDPPFGRGGRLRADAIPQQPACGLPLRAAPRDCARPRPVREACAWRRCIPGVRRPRERRRRPRRTRTRAITVTAISATTLLIAPPPRAAAARPRRRPGVAGCHRYRPLAIAPQPDGSASAIADPYRGRSRVVWPGRQPGQRAGDAATPTGVSRSRPSTILSVVLAVPGACIRAGFANGAWTRRSCGSARSMPALPSTPARSWPPIATRASSTERQADERVQAWHLGRQHVRFGDGFP